MHSIALKLGLASLAASVAVAMPARPFAARQDASGKRGLCFNDPSLTNLFTGSKVTWAYNWDSTTGAIREGLEYVPMLFDNKNGHPEAFNSNVQSAQASGSTHILGFNEPDMGSPQADMDVTTAVQYWNEYIQPLGDSMTLVSPAVTNGGDPMGITYLENFINACTGCKIDAIALHWYDSAANIDYFKNYFNDAYTKFGKQIWITEFGASGSDDEVNTFLQTVLPWLDEQPFIDRYAYFMAAEGKLVSNNALSVYGQTYNDL